MTKDTSGTIKVPKSRRHRKVTDAQIIEALKATGGIYSSCVVWLRETYGIHIDRSAIGKRVAKTEELQEAVADATERMIDLAENNLFAEIKKKNLKATMFYLNNKGKSRGYGVRNNVLSTENPDGLLGKVQIYLPDNGRDEK